MKYYEAIEWGGGSETAFIPQTIFVPKKEGTYLAKIKVKNNTDIEIEWLDLDSIKPEPKNKTP